MVRGKLYKSARDRVFRRTIPSADGTNWPAGEGEVDLALELAVGAEELVGDLGDEGVKGRVTGGGVRGGRRDSTASWNWSGSIWMGDSAESPCDMSTGEAGSSTGMSGYVTVKATRSGGGSGGRTAFP